MCQIVHFLMAQVTFLQKISFGNIKKGIKIKNAVPLETAFFILNFHNYAGKAKKAAANAKIA